MDPKQGGPAEGLKSLLPELSILGIGNSLLCLDEPGAAFLQGIPCEVHPVGGRTGAWSYSPALRPWLRKNLGNYDAVVVNGLWLYIDYAVSREVRRIRRRSGGTGPKHFIYPHGMLDPWFQKAASRKSKAVRNWLYWKLIERHCIAHADGVLFTCEEERLAARGTFKPYSARENVVGLGVNAPPAYHSGMTEAFTGACDGFHGKYILFLSRIHEKKGVDLLIKAYRNVASSLRAAGAGPVPSLVIAGPLDSTYAGEMRRLAGECANPAGEAWGGKIIFPGMLAGDAKWGAFYGCEAFILPSHQENFGIAVVEALACGKPVLISKKVNIWREIIEKGAGLAEDDDEAGARRLLESLLAFSQSDLRAVGERARECFTGVFGIEPAARRLAGTLTAGRNPETDGLRELFPLSRGI